MGTFKSEREMRNYYAEQEEHKQQANKTSVEISEEDRLERLRTRPTVVVFNPATHSFLRSIKKDIDSLGREESEYEVKKKRELDSDKISHLRVFLMLETLLTLGDFRGLIYQATKYLEEKRDV
jgi:hypothetical protein